MPVLVLIDLQNEYLAGQIALPGANGRDCERDKAA